MDSINRQLREPWWQPSRIDITRRRALLGLSAMVMAAASSTHILGQQARSYVIEDAHQGMFFLSTVQPSFLARPGGLPVKSLPASASPLNCHWSHATEAIAQSPPWG